MGNRTTSKAAVTAKIVPKVTNAIHIDVLNNDILDNIVFREDTVKTQSSGSTNITVNFDGFDRINLTRTGGNLNITVSGMDDGDLKYLLITKTTGMTITFVGVTDVTPFTDFVDDESTVLYEIIRKGSNYFARAYLTTVKACSTAEAQAGSIDNKFITPSTLQDVTATTIRAGILETASGTEAKTGTAGDKIMTPTNVSECTKHFGYYITGAAGTYTMTAGYGIAVIELGVPSGIIVRLPPTDTYAKGSQIRVLNLSAYSQTVKTNTGGTQYPTTLLSNYYYIFEYSYLADIWVCVYSGAIPTACPFVYINESKIGEILRNFIAVEKLDILDISEFLTEGMNLVKIAEEKREVTFLKELWFNNERICNNIILQSGQSFSFMINHKKESKAELRAVGFYLPT